MAKYVILGATGQTGTATANALIGHTTVRVAVRNESKGAAWKAQGAEVAIVESKILSMWMLWLVLLRVWQVRMF
ncbi:MAG: hypothetical protein AAF921_21240 [Cyanobacteria bacterium P01_D01_bin.44]